MILVAGACLSQPGGHEHGSSDAATCLLCGGMLKEEMYPCIALATYDRQKRCPCPLPTAALVAGPASHLGSTIELVLDVKAAGDPAQECECGKASPDFCLLCGGISKGEIPFPCTLQSMTNRRAGHGFMRAGELVLFLTCRSIQKSRPRTSPGQHSKAHSDGKGGASKLTPGV